MTILNKNINLIFDMDGTLVNTALVTVPACQKCAQKLNLPVKDSASISKLIGYPDMEFYTRLYSEVGYDLLVKYSEEVEHLENKLMIEMGTKILYDEVHELLNILKKDRYYIFLASTGSTSHVNTALNVSGIFSFFRIIKCNHSDKASMVKEIIKSGPEGNWLIVGDKSSDSKAGKANKITTVAAKYGFGTEEEYAQFDYKIESPLQLLEILAQH